MKLYLLLTYNYMPTTSIIYNLVIHTDVPLFETPDHVSNSIFDPMHNQHYMSEYKNMKENNQSTNRVELSFEKNIELSLIAMVNVDESQIKKHEKGYYSLISKLSCLAVVGFPQLRQFIDERRQHKNTWSLSTTQITPHDNYPHREIGGNHRLPVVVISGPRNALH